MLQGHASQVLPSDDSFERSALHGLCSFHGLQSHSVHTQSGRQVMVKRSARNDAVLQSQASDTLAQVSSKLAGLVDSSQGHSETQWAGRAAPFTAVDVLLVLEDAKHRHVELNKAALAAYRVDHYPAE
jgi:hypothetical protein